MTNAKRQTAVTLKLIMENMVPGIRYTLHQIAGQANGALPHVQALLLSGLTKRVLRSALSGKRSVYWRPTEEELLSESQHASSHATLQGYDATMRRFQELCMATRPPGLAGQTVRSVIGQESTDQARRDEQDT